MALALCQCRINWLFFLFQKIAHDVNTIQSTFPIYISDLDVMQPTENMAGTNYGRKIEFYYSWVELKTKTLQVFQITPLLNSQF